MSRAGKTAPRIPSKIPTGISGFDELSGGGLPRSRTSLLMGGPGSGKTVFALQSLANGVRQRREAGMFVAFEERPGQIIANASSFGWGLPALARHKLFFLDAHLSPATVQSGEFDLGGMLAILKRKKEEIGARWIVFDGIDVLLTLLGNPVAERREIYRVRDWLADNDMTGILTAKIDGGTSGAVQYGFVQFMVDCVIRLDRRLEEGVSVHRIEITKYRGSEFSTGEFPVSFGRRGLEVAAADSLELSHAASSERLTAGFERLDEMLGGGLYRGSSTLVTGAPGTSKTTLAGKFAEAACRRGERTLFISFDEAPEPIARNLSSVGIRLKPHIRSGLLRMYSARTEATGAEEHLQKLRSLIDEQQPRCLVIDPLSAVAKIGKLSTSRGVANRLVNMAKDKGLTTIITALVKGDDPQTEATELQISTIADTWIHLSYLVRSGERNRALSIIKSRGTWHSNQVREIVLGESGPTLTDVYAEEGEVLMGTLRWQKEAEEQARTLLRRTEFDHKQRELEFAEAETRARIVVLERDLQRQRDELALNSSGHEARNLSSSERESTLRRMRNARPAAPTVAAAARTKRPPTPGAPGKTGDGAA